MTTYTPQRFEHEFRRSDSRRERGTKRPGWWEREAIERWYTKRLVRIADGKGLAHTTARFTEYRDPSTRVTRLIVYGEYAVLEGCAGGRYLVRDSIDMRALERTT